MPRSIRLGLAAWCASVLLWSLHLVVLPPLALAAPGDTPPLQIGERLTYEISWLNLVAGTAVMEVGDGGRMKDHSVARLLTTARSSPMVTKFYPIDNRVESWVDTTTFQTDRLTFQRREGKRKDDFEYIFHHEEHTVTVTKNGAAETLPIPPETLDMISCLYHVRHILPLTPGSSMTMNVHHDKKNYKLDVRVEDKEIIEGSWGKAETARVIVIMPFQGIFLNRGNIKVWFTTDERKIPLRMKAKVIIGAVVADLVGGIPEVVQVR